MKRTFLRVVSMCLAVILLAGSVNISVFASQLDSGNNAATLQSTVQANVARNGAVVKTDAQIVAEKYSELSQLEKDILNTGALLGETYQITTPPDSCVTIDAESKTVTAADHPINAGYYWIPVSATAVYAGGQVTKQFNGGDTVQFTAVDIPVDQYSVQVVYELNVTIDSNTQQALLNAPANLAGAVANMNIIQSLSGNLNTLSSYIDDLYAMTAEGGGVMVDLGAMGTRPVTLEAGAATDAVYSLYAEAKKAENNFETFDLCRIMSGYEDDGAVAFVTGSGKDVHSLFDAKKAEINALRASDSSLRKIQDSLEMFGQWGLDLSSYLTMLDAALSLLDSMYATMESVDANYWAAYSNSPIKNEVSAVELSALNAAVLAAVDGTALKAGVSYHNDVTIVNEQNIGTHTVTKGVDQYKILIDVVAHVIEDGDTVTTAKYGVTNHQIVLDKGVDAAAIEAAIEASGIIESSVAAWSYYGVDVAGTYYDITFDVPASLTADTDCTVIFTPKNIFTVDYDYAADETVPYGYTLVLPAHDDVTKSYVYTVGGNKMYQGNSVRVVSDLTVSREEGKSLASETITSFIAGSNVPGTALTDKDRNILKAGGLTVGTIAYSKPENSDVTVEVEQTNLLTNAYRVSATSYPTAMLINGNAVDAVWAPVAVMVGGNKVADFNGTTAEFTYGSEVSKVNVVYRLSVDTAYISLSDAETWAELPAKLAADAAVQANRLSTAVDLISSDSFTKANNLAGTLAAIINTGNYAEKTKAAANTLNDQCLNKDGKLILADLLADYSGKTKSAMLAQYYSGSNSETLNEQITVLAGVFADLSDDTNFLAYVDGIQAGTSELFIEYKDKIANISVPAVNSNINTAASMVELTALAEALLASGSTTADVAVTSPVAYETSVEGVASNLTMVTITVTAGGQNFTETLTYLKGATFSDADIRQIENTIATLKAQAAQVINAKYYDVSPVVLPNVGDAVSAYPSFAVTYTPKQYTVNIAGNTDTFSYNGSAMFINLPRPVVVGGVYRYTVGTKNYDVPYSTSSASFSLQITAADLDTLFDANNSLTITRVEVDTTREDFVKFVNGINTAFRTANMDATLIMATDPTDYSLVLRVGPAITGAQYQAMMADLMAAIAGKEITLAGSTFYDGGASISVQAIVDMMASSGFSFNTVYNIIDANGKVKNDAALVSLTGMNNVGGKVVTADMTLNGLPIDLYITLYGSSSQLLAARDAVGTFKNYVNLSCENGVYNVHLNMPDKAYPYYMSAMLLLDQTSFEDIQGSINVGKTMKYYKGLITDLTSDPNFTVDTLESTLAEVGKTVDLSTYADVFDLARKLVNYLINNGEATNEVSDNEHYEATMTYPVSNLFKSLPASYAKLADFIVESQNGGELSFNVNITMEDRKTDYDAMIFDNSEAGLNKFYYADSNNFTSALAGLGKNSVVVLISDAKLKNDVTIPNNVFINLNGFKLEGNMTTKGTVTISDSTLHTTTSNVGTYAGTLTGNFIITGGQYGNDVTALLKEGYIQDANGFVYNKFYTIEEDADGNIDINISAGILATRTIPEIKALAVDIAFDLAFNVYNASSLIVDGNGIYSFATEDLLDLATKPGREILNVLIDKVNVENVKALAKSIYYELTDFAAVSDKIANDEAIVDYDLITNGWQPKFGITDKNTVKLDLVAGKQIDRTLAIRVVGSADDKRVLSALFDEVDKMLTYDVTLGKISIGYDGGLNVDYSGALDVAIDLSYNPNYGALVAAAVASANNKDSLKAAVKAYIEDGTLAALIAELEKVTVEEFVNGLNHLKNAGCEAILNNLGVSSTAIEDLADIYSDLVYISATILNRLDNRFGFADSTRAIAGYKVAGKLASYEFGPKTVKNIEFALTLTLFDESEISDPSIDLDTSDAHILGYVIDGDHFYLDVDVNGITEAELLSYVTFANPAASATVTTNAAGLVTTGSVLTVTLGGESKSYTIIIDGDVNCDGRVSNADIVQLKLHYYGVSVTIDPVVYEALDVDNNQVINNGDVVRMQTKYWYWIGGYTGYKSILVP